MNVPFAARQPKSIEGSEYHRALRRETLESERLRAKALAILAIVTAAGVAAVIAVALISQSGYEGALRERMEAGKPVTVLIPFIAYEFWMMALLRRRLAAGRDISILRRYLNVLIETSLPTVILLFQMRVMDPEDALGFTAPMLYFLFIVLSTLRLDFWLSVFTGAVAAIELAVVGATHLARPGAVPIVDFDATMTLMRFGGLRSAMLLIGGILAGWVAIQLRRQLHGTLTAVAARDRVTNLFGQHVSPQVVERLLTAGTANLSEVNRVAIMFVDIRSFTTAASKRQPEVVVERLDALFSVLVAVVDRHSGIVNKFLGDGFLAVFGAPLPEARAAHRAVAAGQEMLAGIEEHNDQRREWPIEIGIAVHVGEVVTGNVGSPNRKEFTVIGDTVNMASRIEAMNKEFGAHFLVSDAVRQELGDEASAFVPLGEVPIRGYDDPIRLWRVA